MVGSSDDLLATLDALQNALRHIFVLDCAGFSI
jgi:hypothetical protein